MRIIFTILLLFCASCSSFLQPPFLPDAPEGGPPEFQEGWKDAENYCRTYVFEYAVRGADKLFDLRCSLDGLSDECADGFFESGQSNTLLGSEYDVWGGSRNFFGW